MFRDSDDQTLWDAAVGGDAEAFGVLFERHQKSVYNYCFRRIGSWSLAEDLTASVFLEAWRTRRPLDLTSRLTSSHRRSTAKRADLLAEVGQLEPAPDFADDVAARLDDERRMNVVLDALRILPQRDQDVLSACVFAGLGYHDAAEALGIPVGTVRSRLSRARRRLESQLVTGSGDHTQGEKP